MSPSSISRRLFKTYILDLPLDKILRKLKGTPKGARLYPSQTEQKDRKANLRADKGATLPDGREEIIFQANKNAEDKGVQESAQKDSHRIVAKIAVDPNKKVEPKDVLKDAMCSFDENN